MNNHLQLLTKYVQSESGYSGDIDPEEDLISAEILDSFSIVSLAMFAQEQFNVEFEPDDLTRENLAYLSNLAALIRKRQAENTTNA